MATIKRASLSASVLGVDKTYDGTAAASFTDSLSGVLGNDVVRLTGTGVFVDKNAGLNKQVTVSGLGLTGADAGNYLLSSSSALTMATINRASLSASVLGVDKTYDGTAAASFTDSLSGVLGNDVVRLTGTGVFIDKNAGLNKQVTVSGLGLTGAMPATTCCRRPRP